MKLRGRKQSKKIERIRNALKSLFLYDCIFFISMAFDLGTFAGVIVLLIAVAGILWRFAVWYGGLKEWRKKIDEWKTKGDNLNLERWMGGTDTKLNKVSLLSEINDNYDFILDEVDKKSKLFIYADMKTQEEKIVGIAPSIVHELIKANKIEEKKVESAMEELGKIFGANVATYYGVLLLLRAYIFEKRNREESSISDTASQKLVDRP
jgi:nitrate reductase gamma subunit